MDTTQTPLCSTVTTRSFVLSAVVLLLQVCAMRMPVDMLLQWLPQMMEGMLIWSDDSKNKFRLKVGAALWKHRLQ